MIGDNVSLCNYTICLFIGANIYCLHYILGLSEKPYVPCWQLWVTKVSATVHWHRGPYVSVGLPHDPQKPSPPSFVLLLRGFHNHIFFKDAHAPLGMGLIFLCHADSSTPMGRAKLVQGVENWRGRILPHAKMLYIIASGVYQLRELLEVTTTTKSLGV